MPTKDLIELIEFTGQRMLLLELTELTEMAAHEYDDQAVLPLEGSPGAKFLRVVARGFGRWIAQQGRFPTAYEVDEVAADWRQDPAMTGSVVAQTFVDLGLYYSAHATAAKDATLEGFSAVLDEVAGQLVVTLTEEYGPLV